MQLYIAKIRQEEFENRSYKSDNYRISNVMNSNNIIRTCSESFVRYILKTEYKVSNENVQYKKTCNGKPYILGYENFHFNISHTDELIVCAVHYGPIGVDVEKVTARNYSKLVDKLFHKEEISYIYQENAIFSTDYFFDIWCSRESFIKFMGTGLSLEFWRYRIIRKTNKLLVAILDEKVTQTNIQIINAIEGIRIAVCTEDYCGIEIKVIHSFEPLLTDYNNRP